MINTSLERLDYLCNTIPALLLKMDDEDFSRKPAPDKWSKKEILGHLIDSAANNHQRFVRVQFEKEPTITYDQDNWVKHSYHQTRDTKTIIQFWEQYNRFLMEILKNIPAELLSKKTFWDNNEAVTLKMVVEDYVRHMEYHLRQIVVY